MIVVEKKKVLMQIILLNGFCLHHVFSKKKINRNEVSTDGRCEDEVIRKNNF